MKTLLQMEKLKIREVLPKDHPSNNWQTWKLGLVNSKVWICSFSIKLSVNFICPHLKSDLLAPELNVLLLLLLMHYYWGGYLLNCGSYLCFTGCSVWFLQAMSFAQRLLRRWESSDDAKVTLSGFFMPPAQAISHFTPNWSMRKTEEEWQDKCVTGEDMNLLPGGSSYSHTNNISLSFLQDFSQVRVIKIFLSAYYMPAFFTCYASITHSKIYIEPH